VPSSSSMSGCSGCGRRATVWSGCPAGASPRGSWPGTLQKPSRSPVVPVVAMRGCAGQVLADVDRQQCRASGRRHARGVETCAPVR
jgi:hypothetical protein